MTTPPPAPHRLFIFANEKVHTAYIEPSVMNRREGRRAVSRERFGVTMTEQANQFWPDDQVRSFLEWCRACNFSPATGRRVIKSGKGPLITRLSDRRIGIRGRHHRRWLDERAGITPVARGDGNE
jgi:hypothetical protein